MRNSFYFYINFLFIVLVCIYVFNINIGENYNIMVKAETINIEENNVEHFFTHELIYNTDLAFSNKNSLKNNFDRDHLTVAEFKKILNSLYNANYILVNFEDVYEELDGRYVKKTNTDFNGKKPLILSFDDMTYDTKGRGIVEKILVKDGEIYDYSSIEEEKYSQDRDCVTVLEKFIEKNPDFSYNSARAILCVTGYNGILGYRVFEGTYLNEKKLEEEEKKLIELIKTLKEKGYRFASHSYGHLNTAFASYEKFRTDIIKWDNEVKKYVGETKIFCYPEGGHRSGSVNNELLKKNGFKIFLCTGNKPTEKENNENILYLYRHTLDGRALRNCEIEYEKFFNTKEIYDYARHVSFEYKEKYY